MRACGIFLCVLGLCSILASGTDRSTQIYYSVLTIEASAIKNLTEMLKTFQVHDAQMDVTDLEMTTRCETLGERAGCSCTSGHVWSSVVCDLRPECCDDETLDCSFPKESPEMCYPEGRVTIVGSVYLAEEQYYDSLSDPTSERFKKRSADLIKEMKPVYSTLTAFDSIVITRFRSGSVTAYFEVNINREVKSKDLEQKAITLGTLMNASINLNTTGLVKQLVPQNPVRFHSSQNISCYLQDNVSTTSSWELTRLEEVFGVTNGTESTVSTASRRTTLLLNNTSELWAGIFTCTFIPVSSSSVVTIRHSASTKLDIALLPQIDIISEPQFPRCKEASTETVAVRVKCEIRNSTETYNVTWNVRRNKTEVQELQLASGTDSTVYAADTSVNCLETDDNSAYIACVFTNRRNQTKTASRQIIVIQKGSAFCRAADGWPDTKADYTAVLRCHGSTGDRTRNCTKNAKWEEEVSNCVDKDLFNILEETTNLNKGLGTVDENAHRVFSRLSNATSDAKRISSYSNLNASVSILSNMQKLDHKFIESTLEDIVASSSNLLANSSDMAWQPSVQKGGIAFNKLPFRNVRSTTSLAEKYLTTVERLISQIHFTKAASEERLNVEVQACTREPCANMVFNNSVSVDGPGVGGVKTVGYRNLIDFLPRHQDMQPNGIIVSATLDAVPPPELKVFIDFKLDQKRPRNYKMMCVFWDEDNGEWSSAGCDWGGPANEGRCECRHLSSFSILMSKMAEDIPYSTALTLAGLCVSIVSLLVFLGVELLVWNIIVKSNSLCLRHTALINIALCLLVADCCFLVSDFTHHISKSWCKIFVILKHFSFLSMFFWMLCLSVLLLYQVVFIFNLPSKKSYLGIAFAIGYVLPFLIVSISVITYGGGAENYYYTSKGCWLIYGGLLKGSIYTFILPVVIIVFINLFSMLVVIMKILNHPKEMSSAHKGHSFAKSILRTVILLTPVFGTTWMFGFAVLAVDLAYGDIALVANYIFIVLNTLQGFFILLTTCLGERTTRDALIRRVSSYKFSSNANTISLDSSTKKM